MRKPVAPIFRAHCPASRSLQRRNLADDASPTFVEKIPIFAEPVRMGTTVNSESAPIDRGHRTTVGKIQVTRPEANPYPVSHKSNWDLRSNRARRVKQFSLRPDYCRFRRAGCQNAFSTPGRHLLLGMKADFSGSRRSLTHSIRSG